MPVNSYPPSLERTVQDLLKRVKDLENSPLLNAATVSGGAIIVTTGGAVQTADFDGDLETNAPGTMGWGLGGPDSAAIFNTLTTRDGIITNSSLASPLVPASGFQMMNGYAVTTTPTTQATVTLAVPSGYSRLLLQAVVNDNAVNDSGSDDFLNSQINVHYSSDNLTMCPSATVHAGDLGMAMCTASVLLTGLAGGNVLIESQPSSVNAGWSANAANATVLSMIGFFLR